MSLESTVNLCVGGRSFAVSRDVLTSGSGFFRALLSPTWRSSDDAGEIFLDRNPDAFEHVLALLQDLRAASIVGGRPPNEKDSTFPTETWARELEFYGIEEPAKLPLPTGSRGPRWMPQRSKDSDRRRRELDELARISDAHRWLPIVDEAFDVPVETRYDGETPARRRSADEMWRQVTLGNNGDPPGRASWLLNFVGDEFREVEIEFELTRQDGTNPWSRARDDLLMDGTVESAFAALGKRLAVVVGGSVRTIFGPGTAVRHELLKISDCARVEARLVRNRDSLFARDFAGAEGRRLLRVRLPLWPVVPQRGPYDVFDPERAVFPMWLSCYQRAKLEVQNLPFPGRCELIEGWFLEDVRLFCRARNLANLKVARHPKFAFHWFEYTNVGFLPTLPVAHEFGRCYSLNYGSGPVDRYVLQFRRANDGSPVQALAFAAFLKCDCGESVELLRATERQVLEEMLWRAEYAPPVPIYVLFLDKLLFSTHLDTACVCGSTRFGYLDPTLAARLNVSDDAEVECHLDVVIRNPSLFENGLTCGLINW